MRCKRKIILTALRSFSSLFSSSPCGSHHAPRASKGIAKGTFKGKQSLKRWARWRALRSATNSTANIQKSIRPLGPTNTSRVDPAGKYRTARAKDDWSKPPPLTERQGTGGFAFLKGRRGGRQLRKQTRRDTYQARVNKHEAQDLRYREREIPLASLSFVRGSFGVSRGMQR